MSQAPGPGHSLAIRRAVPEDLADIMRIERQSFRSPWPRQALDEELQRPEAVYLVASRDGRKVGYGGMWLCPVDAHVGTLAVASESRRGGIGEAIMLALLDYAVAGGAPLVHLEYRVSNEAAAALYARLGFRRTRLRRGYYAEEGEEGEDAIEVLLEDLQSPPVLEHLRRLAREWEQRHGGRLGLTFRPDPGD
jgi:[ribosomal protein S18]-alanine N-acetyltransferase